MTDTPLVSVVTATRNRLNWLARALHSIRTQSLTDLESITVDDGSDQATRDAYPGLWKELDDRFRLDLPPLAGYPGRGAGGARNRGIELARGRYIAFCDDDDRWLANDHLETAIAAMERTGAAFYFTNMQGESHEQVTIPDWFPGSPQLTAGALVNQSPRVHQVSLEALMQTMHHHYPHPNGCVFRTEVVKSLKGFWEVPKVGEDVNLILRYVDRTSGILYRPDRIVGFNVTPRDSAWVRAVNHAYLAPLDCTITFKHAQLLCTQPIVQRCARALEAWNTRELSREVAAAGRPKAAVPLAWQALTLSPSAGGVAFLASTLWRAVSAGFHRPHPNANALPPA